MLKRNFIYSVVALIGGLVLVSSCSEDSRGLEFMPDMYRGPAIETYQAIGDSGTISARKPAANTIPRGFLSYQKYSNNQAGYDSAMVTLKMPADFPTDSITLHEGAKLYGIFCAHCHGDKGDGQGILMKREKILGIPSYETREINLGSTFYVMTYGKGIMGSHASQVTPSERWKIAQHVMELRSILAGEGEEEVLEVEAVADSTVVVAEQITN